MTEELQSARPRSDFEGPTARRSADVLPLCLPLPDAALTARSKEVQEEAAATRGLVSGS